MQKIIVLFLFAISIIHASEGQQADTEWKKIVEDFGSENPPCAVPFFCRAQRRLRSSGVAVLAYGLNAQEAHIKKNQ